MFKVAKIWVEETDLIFNCLTLLLKGNWSEGSNGFLVDQFQCLMRLLWVSLSIFDCYVTTRSIQFICSSWAFKQLYIWVAHSVTESWAVIISWLWPGERNIKPNISCFSPRLKSDLGGQKGGSQSGDTGLGYRRHEAGHLPVWHHMIL